MAQFDNEYYYSLYPDVKEAVQKGWFMNGEAHYRSHGQNEGRNMRNIGDWQQPATLQRNISPYSNAPKLNICTLCDYNYLPKGLSLYMSLLELNEPFILRWLLLDKKAYDAITNLRLKNVETYFLEDLEQNDPELVKAKSNPPSNYGDSYSQYCWALTPYFINHLLHTEIENDKYLIYIDADIFMYKSVNEILKVVSDKSIGIHTHRFSGEYNNNHDTGWFNVGIVIFKNNNIGREASDNWKKWLLNPNNEYFTKYGTCGDQKYLELIYELYKQNISIFDYNILHGSPWCSSDIGDKPIHWYHFSHFCITSDYTWSDSYKGEWKPASEPGIRKYYVDYAKYNKKGMLLIDFKS